MAILESDYLADITTARAQRAALPTDAPQWKRDGLEEYINDAFNAWSDDIETRIMDRNARQAFRAYLETAIWSSVNWDTEEPLDNAYSAADITGESRLEQARLFHDFWASNETLIEQAVESEVWDSERIGQDFWLTRNGHGAGFWDRGAGKVGDELTEAAKSWGTCDVYVGDENRLHFDE